MTDWEYHLLVNAWTFAGTEGMILDEDMPEELRP